MIRFGYYEFSTIDKNEWTYHEGGYHRLRESKHMGPESRAADSGIKADRIYTDHASGKDKDRPQLQQLLDFARDGDTVIVHSMDRLARNLDDLRSIVTDLTDRGITIQFLKEQLTFTDRESSPIANLLLSVMGAVSEFERALLKERQRQGIALAKKKGKYKGRKPSLTAEQVSEIKIKLDEGVTKTHLAKHYGISRETLYQYLRHPS